MSSFAFTVQVEGQTKSFRINRDQSFVSAHSELRESNAYFLVFDGDGGKKEIGPLDNQRDGEKILKRFSRNWAWLPWATGATVVVGIIVGAMIAMQVTQPMEARSQQLAHDTNMKAMMDEAVRRAMADEEPLQRASTVAKVPSRSGANTHPDISQPAEGWKR